MDVVFRIILSLSRGYCALRFSILDILAATSYFAICVCCVSSKELIFGRGVIPATVLLLGWLLVRSYRRRNRFLHTSTMTAFTLLVLFFGTGMVSTASLTPIPWWLNPLTAYLSVFPSPVDYSIGPATAQDVLPLGIAPPPGIGIARFEAANATRQWIQKEGKEWFNCVRLSVCVSSLFFGVVMGAFLELLTTIFKRFRSE